MLQRRTPDPLKGELVLDPAYYVRRQLAFWETLSKIAKRRGCEDVLKISLEAAARIEDHLSRHRIEPKDKDIEMEDKDTSGKLWLERAYLNVACTVSNSRIAVSK
jgi:hypothetical protein